MHEEICNSSFASFLLVMPLHASKRSHDVISGETVSNCSKMARMEGTATLVHDHDNDLFAVVFVPANEGAGSHGVQQETVRMRNK